MVGKLGGNSLKKVGILIGTVIILLAIFFIVVKTDKPDQVQNTNTVVNINENGKIERFAEKLKEEGITLTNKEEITSEQINENGYSYELNGETIEIYNVSQEKIKNIIVAEKAQEITIRTMQGKRINAIYYDEILILNCIKNINEILDALKSQK